MSISQNYAYMQQKIADELGDRTDLLAPLADNNALNSPIQDAIQSAIALWEREPFYFLESYEPFLNLVAGQEFYTTTDAAAIATAPRIVQLRVMVNGQRYGLTPRDWQYLEETSVNPQVTSSYPSDWAYYAETLRFYPIPSQALPIQASYDQRLANLVEGGDSNVWTQDGYDLIKEQAKLTLARGTLHSESIADACLKALYGTPGIRGERGYVNVLKQETARRSGRARVRPSYF